MKVLNLGVIALGICALTACGGGSNDSDSSTDSTQPSSPSQVSIQASVVQSKAVVDIESQTVVEADADIDFRLTSVKQVNHGATCEITSIEGMSFTTLSSEIGECQFEYTVAPVEQDVYAGQASSLARVSVSETAEENTLPNLSETTDVETPVTIDLSEELESDLDTSTYSVSEEITLLGSGSVEVDSINNTITYTPVEIGVTRIMYSVSDDSSTKLGNIDVAVSDTGNTPPVANDYIREGKLAKDMSVEIDLTDSISDAEDSVVLDSVRAYNAETEITSATEHTFTFKSSEPGPHEVAYTVTDGRGGYAVGQVYIEIEPDFSLVQDWEDISILDSVLNSDITYSAPMSKAMADYVNSSYMSVQTENGDYGLDGAQIVEMNWLQAKNYCETRNGRLPLERELEALAETEPYKSSNWPTSTPYWAATKVSKTDGATVSLIDGSLSSQSTEDAGYVSCVYLEGDVKDFSISNVENNDHDEPTSTLRYVTATLLDPDGLPAPYQNVTFWTRSETGGFGIKKNDLEIEEMTDVDGSATAVYSFTSGYEDSVMAQYRESALFTIVRLQSSGFDVTNPDDWNISKIYGDLPLSDFEPIIDEKGTMVATGQTKEYIISISKTPIIGDHVTIKFSVDRTEAQTLTAGNTNIIFQQVNSKAPDINETCSVLIYGDCEWSGSNKDTAGFPQNDERSFGFIFDYYNSKTIKYLNNNNEEARGDLLNRGKRLLYYKIVIKDKVVSVYQATQSDYSDESLSLTHPMGDIDIDFNKFFYFGLSGGAHSFDGVHARVTSLDYEM